ncbi:putative disease resistance protein At3g14460 [Neltuma alba]|uniref:putative disease resistance protein At3g14460 n=1 Tax=Neltuma alba TaxID=207710 RepID=UPI0010A3369F|nr:putative disease resistance protein At3g14460 [Prosopis alba]
MISWQEWHLTDTEAFPKLRTLRIHDCPKLIGNLPPQLPSLEFLEIEECPQLASSIPKCPNIRELVIIRSQNVVLQEQELAPSLRSLAVSGARMLEPLSEKLHIQDLYVGDCSNNAVPLSVIIHMPRLVERLVIRDCENLKFVLVSEARLHLRRISIYNCKFLTSLFDDMERLLPTLKELCISYCPEMEPFSAGLLPSRLKRLEIRNCDKLLSSQTEWHHLPNITELRISTDSDTLHCTGLQHLTSLQELQIWDSPNLEKLEGGTMPPSLQRLHIWDCGLLKERCRNKDGEIWPKISHVPHVSLHDTDSRLDANTNEMHRYSDSVKCTGNQEGDITNTMLQPYWGSEILKDGGYTGRTFPSWSGGRSYNHLIELYLTNCDNCRRIPALGQLPALRSLTISDLRNVVTVGSEFLKGHDCSLLVPFPSLETLSIEDMAFWQEWHSIDMEAFPKLRALFLYNCYKLIGNLPPQLISLKCLVIEGCPQLASSIPKCPSIDELAIIRSRNVVLQEQELPPSLRHLTISGKRMLEHLSEKLHLEKLTVRDCSDAVPPPVIHVPPSVEQLFIEECENLKFVLVSEAPLVHLQSISICNCKCLTSVFDDIQCLLPNLKELSIEKCPEMELFSPGCLPSSLKQLEITACDKLLSCHTQWHHLPAITELVICTQSQTLHCTGLQHLTSLQELRIWDCPRLEKIEGGMMPPSLQRLLIWRCSLLEEQCRNKDEEIWPIISHVPQIRLNGMDLIRRRKAEVHVDGAFSYLLHSVGCGSLVKSMKGEIVESFMRRVEEEGDSSVAELWLGVPHGTPPCLG